MLTNDATTVSVEPAILYFGTPVVLISTRNADGNLLRTGECVLNLPSPNEVAAVNRMARLMGSDPIPAAKLVRDYAHESSRRARSSARCS